MKKFLLSIFCLCAISYTTKAQTITLEEASPHIGDTYVQASSDYVDPGTPGMNQTWDLSGLTNNQEYSSDIVNPAAQSGASNFPNATIAFVSGDQVGYSIIGNNKIEVAGLYNAGTVMTFPNPRTQLQFPLSYQSTFDDTYERFVDLTGDVANQEIGSVTGFVDGAGTVITPSGTFENVLRVKLETTAILNTIYQGDVISSIDYSDVGYTYIQAGSGYPLASIIISEYSGQTSTVVTYLISSTTGISDLKALSELTIFPVPTSTDLTVSFNLESSSEVSYNLFAIDGRLIGQLAKSTLPKGENSIVLALPRNCTSGVYLLQISTQNGVTTRRIIIE